MINLKHQLPSIYYDASRDFQILGHLYEVVLNYSKTNADMLYLLPNGLTEDARITEVLATTLGFKLRRNYDKTQLAALVSIFPQLLRIKGTKRAIDLAGDALVKASGVPGSFHSELQEKEQLLIVKIPVELTDITLFMDLLPYILPFGIRVSIVRMTVRKETATLPISTTAVVRKALPGFGPQAQQPLGLAKISEDGSRLDYSSYQTVDSKGEVKAGLMGATPVIAFETENSFNTVSTENEEEKL